MNIDERIFGTACYRAAKRIANSKPVVKAATMVKNKINQVKPKNVGNRLDLYLDEVMENISAKRTNFTPFSYIETLI